MNGILLILIGAVTAIIGSIGIVRFPDFFSRTHAQTVVTVGGTCLMILGFAFESFGRPESWKLFILIAIIFVTSPAATHIIAKAAYKKSRTKNKT
jgi:multicomponent Na+:H+ antiporter subunit G